MADMVKYVLFPPLVLFKPRSKEEEHAVTSHPETHGHQSHHTHGNPHAAAQSGQHSAFWPILCAALIGATMYRFSEDESYTTKGAGALLIGPYRAPDGCEALVGMFWMCVLAALTYVSYLCRPAHVHGIDHMLIPEIVALGVFYFADTGINVIRLADTNSDGQMELHEFVENMPKLIMSLPMRWMQANLSLCLSATIVQTISPTPYTWESIVYNLCWNITLSQAVSHFLFSSVRRGEDLHDWGSTFASVIFGGHLYFYTHGIALLAAVVFRKHEGAEHPPTLIKVFHTVRKADPAYAVQIGFFTVAVLAANMIPPLLDHAGKCVTGEGCPPVWLQAVSKGLYAGPITALTLSAINVGALVAGYRASTRGPEKKPHNSYESVLTWTTGAIATFCWCDLMLPGSGAPVWKWLAVLLGAISHFALAAVSADTFSGRMEPNIQEAVVMAFWASTQCFQGLAVEHHAATAHFGHGDHGMSINGLLNHMGEFGLCEFGLITTLAWITLITEKIVHVLPLKGKRWGLQEPLLHKKS